MFSAPVRTCLLLTVVAVLVASAGPAQPLVGNQKEPGVKVKEVAPGYTAFPDLKPPLRPEGFVDYDKLTERVFKNLPLLIPDDATPLRKVQLHQVNEGAGYLKKMFEVIQIGNWRPSDLDGVLNVASEVFRVAAETEATPAARLPRYEDRVLMLKALEEFVTIRVQTGNDPPQNLHFVRFRRLQTEADLLKLKEEIEKAGKK